MAKTTGVFGIETGGAGVSIVPVRNYITNAELSNAGIDTHVALAKADLDATAKRAKAALAKWTLELSDADRT